MNKTKRTGLSWPAEFSGEKLEAISSLRKALGSDRKADLGNRPLFFLALAYAFNEGLIDDEVPPRKTNSARLSELNENHFHLLESIAIHYSGDRSILVEEDEVIDIAERFVSAGIKSLVHEHQTNPNFRGWLSAKIWTYLRSRETVL